MKSLNAWMLSFERITVTTSQEQGARVVFLEPLVKVLTSSGVTVGSFQHEWHLLGYCIPRYYLYLLCAHVVVEYSSHFFLLYI